MTTYLPTRYTPPPRRLRRVGRLLGPARYEASLARKSPALVVRREPRLFAALWSVDGGGRRFLAVGAICFVAGSIFPLLLVGAIVLGLGLSYLSVRVAAAHNPPATRPRSLVVLPTMTPTPLTAARPAAGPTSQATPGVPPGLRQPFFIQVIERDLAPTEIVEPEPESTPEPAHPLIGWPAKGTISQGFGCSPYYTGIPGPGCPAEAPWFHDGVDIAAGAGTPVQASLAGTVVFAGADGSGPVCRDGYRGYGQAVVIDSGAGWQALLRQSFNGDNPWPELPPFPPSENNPGLAAMSRLERVAPSLRAKGQALILGRDGEGKRVGFDLPELDGLKNAWIFGREAERVAVALTCQAVRQLRIPTLVLDGQGAVATQLARRLLREIALGRAYTCDAERPAQARFRLNPLWLPADAESWPGILSTSWVEWLRELGVTAGGLGQVAYRHTLAAVVLTSLTMARQSVGLDVGSLRDALHTPDYLAGLDGNTLMPGALDEATQAWWLAEGRRASTFDAHLRLGHLRARLSALLELPEYKMLWRPLYLDPLQALSSETCGLFWRAPDPRRRLRPYITSQLLAVATLLAAWPAERPVLIILHELEAGPWAHRLASFPAARVVLSSESVPALDRLPAATSLVVSHLARADAGKLEGRLLAEVQLADLRRLPANRVVFQRGREWGTVDLEG